MTTPAEFKANVLSSLKWLDSHLPAGSYVILLGLLHGEEIWNVMHDKYYPYFGITYEDLWAILSTEWKSDSTLNPCWGWLNPDVKWRQATSQRARALDAVFDEIIANHTFKNFETYFIECPDKQVIQSWLNAGRDGRDLYEAVGGAHPSQTQGILWNRAIWNTLLQHYPQVVGPVNPHNAEIARIFGNQHGY